MAPSSSCVGMVRTVYPELARAAGDDELQRRVDALARGSSSSRSCSCTGSASTDVGARFPAPGHLPPDLPLAAGDARRRRAAAAARAASRASSWSSCRTPTRVLRLRRHVRDQERRDLERDPGRQVPRRSSRPAPRSAPRSTAPACCRSAAGSARERPGARRSTSPRSSRAADERDRAGVPGGRRARRSQTAQLRANLRHATATIRDEARAGRRRAPRLGGAARGRPGDQGRRARTPRRVPAPVRAGASSAAGGDRPLGARRRRGERGSSLEIAAQPRRHRGRQGQVADDRRDRAQRRARRRRASTRSRPTSPS